MLNQSGNTEQKSGTPTVGLLVREFESRQQRFTVLGLLGLEGASQPPWQIGHTLDLAGSPNELRNIKGAGT